ncbi:2,4-dienoyl-CoA reductase-like NADH-dependent reductase (Old Yellow Enzyme family) [Dysgonomonas sp. PFB1-18]|uniref:NADH:flavin oxidoreductase/NADH oxidase n=1 Tax=unclassified Dysgonomonas TaxID=2630389 RepID=UPI0024756543|nr:MULTISPECIES: NADH:flavin oxidoreductase/NADH oxidase [unclassified Dysgonomonas]MDH6307810.1 2,4-dienoyl-CoA reductase-like NADH-dependent reductase (Old Yellow Enzyme family) [Dysgonomonas sp. PF1-14]MDH6337728.1 2,4-dienoyl-CoA reductase-like NADH-dependent reductase (Old Yellow Enzyme family) [Dysgonomonas sp. PF1-16]MDH6378952.1 2,4-dienoyl-CoA reductase-like NADH-dependent reductase (Old Yellow Enzyme family) [Dysgonomonas sp. PFB1-18]MDH6396587.1 2,4-dienoyl-CoA reductase-like NADH-de
MSKLFTPLKIRNLILKNRIVMSPMCQYSATDGFANDWHLVHYGSRAVGGSAAIIQEATAVCPEGRISYGDLGIWKDEHITKLSEIADFVSKNGAIPGIQLAHAGRKASCDLAWNGGGQLKEDRNSWTTVSASAIPFYEADNSPVELSKVQIEKIIDDFALAAQRAVKAGYKIIEIHAAHGYLIHQFLSPLTNKRNDEYGGTFENRIRLILKIVDAIALLMNEDHSLWVRISATDWTEGGWSVEESAKLTGLLKGRGVDVIDVSSGGNIPHVKIPVGKSYQVPFAEKIKKQTGIITGAVGLIDDAQQAEDILAKGQADLIFIGRELLRDAYFPLHAAQKLNNDIEWKNQYIRVKQSI